MKNMFKILTVAIGAFLLIGCSSIEIKPPETRTPLEINTREAANTVVLEGRISYENTTAMQSAALELREVAKIMKEKGYKYFTLSSRYANPLTTNFSDFVAYCFPDNAGSAYKDYGQKSTSLENGKCKFPEITFKEGSSKGYRVVAYGFVEPKLDTASWSVNQVLNDAVIDEYIQAGYKDAEIHPKNQRVSFKENKRLPLY